MKPRSLSVPAGVRLDARSELLFQHYARVPLHTAPEFYVSEDIRTITVGHQPACLPRLAFTIMPMLDALPLLP